MPQYTFTCSTCGWSTELMLSMADSDKAPSCEVCGFDTRRDYQADLFMPGNKDYATPIHSDSLAISPTQVKEHNRLFPDVKLDSECRPILENYQQHSNYLEKTGFVKHAQKTRKSSCGKTFKQGKPK